MELTSSTLAAVLDSVEELVAYARDKALFEADCRMREKAAALRSAMFACESVRSITVTKELARCKVKLKLLKNEASRLPETMKQLTVPLLDELEERISGLRKLRLSPPHDT